MNCIKVSSKITLPCLQHHSAQYYVRHSKALCSAARDSSVRWRCAFRRKMSKSTRKLRGSTTQDVNRMNPETRRK